VAQNKTVTWRGNANAWIKNARAAGEKTGKIPVVGAIVQFSGAGYNPYYGHVGIVAGIEGGDIIVKDMNYR
jgi:peptidoglycan DL-endopeptidase CwlO